MGKAPFHGLWPQSSDPGVGYPWGETAHSNARTELFLMNGAFEDVSKKDRSSPRNGGGEVFKSRMKEAGVLFANDLTKTKDLGESIRFVKPRTPNTVTSVR